MNNEEVEASATLLRFKAYKQKSAEAATSETDADREHALRISIW